MIVECHLLFRFVEQSFFRALIELLRSNVSVSGRIKMIKICENHVKSMKKTIFQLLINVARYFLTIDVWTNLFSQSFLKMTIYFINDNWEYKKLLLSFKSLYVNHIDWKMANVIIQFLEKYNIESRLLAFTTDSAKFNDTLRLHLDDLFREKFKFDWNHQKKTIRCMIHVVQLILNAIFKTLKISDEEMNETSPNSVFIKSIKSTVFWNNTIAKVIIITLIYHTYLSHLLTYSVNSINNQNSSKKSNQRT